MKIPARKPRKDYYTAVTWLALIGTLLFRIPLERLMGDKGIAYFSVANEIYLVVAGALSYGLSEAVATAVRYRTRRAQFKNARKVLRNALWAGGGIGFLLSLCVGFGGQGLAGKVFHIPLAGMAVRMMAPAMFFSVLTGILKGYFQGNGSRLPSVHSELLHTIFLLIGGLLGASILYKYGVKVSALLQNEDYAGVYGAMGASIGLLVASVLCFFHTLILYVIFRKNADKLAEREQAKGQESGFRILYMLMGSGAVYGFYFLCFHILPLLDQAMFMGADTGQGTYIAQWGAYYGRCLVVTGIVCGGINMVCLLPVKRIVAGMERGDQTHAKERLGILMHQCAVISIPAAAFLAVFSESLLDLLFAGNNRQAAFWLQIGCVAIVFQIFSSLFMEILIYGRRVKFAAGIGVVALLLHMGIALLFLKAAKLGIVSIIIAVIIFYGAVTVLGFLLISRLYGYRQEWIRTFAVTIIAAAVSGVLAMLLNKLFMSLLGGVLSLFICILVGTAVYLVLLVVLRAFENGELEEMAGGRLLIRLADLLHFS